MPKIALDCKWCCETTSNFMLLYYRFMVKIFHKEYSQVVKLKEFKH